MSVSRIMVRKARRRRAPVSGLEKLVRGWLDTAGVDYQTQFPVGRCHVDLLLGEKLIVEINGCYWHSCPKCHPENTKADLNKRAKDRRRYKHLLLHGYKLMLLWECQVHEKGEVATVTLLRKRLESGV